MYLYSSLYCTWQGVFVDDSGHVLYGPNANFAILTQDDVLVSPPEGSAMEGFTLQNLLRLIPEVRTGA